MQRVKTLILGAAALGGMSFVPAVSGQCEPQEVAKLLASDGAADDRLGFSVSISGDTAIVGAPYSDPLGWNSGSVYMHERVGDSWSEVTKLTAGAVGGNFGWAVSISGDIAIVGAPYDDDGSGRTGSAYIFERHGGVWTQTAKLLASDGAADDHFGWAVSISDQTAVVGAYSDDNYRGSAYAFEKIGGVWTQTAKLRASDGTANDRFGYSVAISGDTTVVGAIYDDGSRGAAYVFDRVGNAWTQTAKLRAADGQLEDYFGISVSISGDTASVGAMLDDDNGESSGSAYVFERTGGVWMQTGKLLAFDGAAHDEFGRSVSISGETVVVGASYGGEGDYGSAYVFGKSTGVWTQTAQLLASDGAGTDWGGFSVSISDETTVVGAWAADGNEPHSGAAYVFDLACSCRADFNGDGVVDTRDFVAFLNTWAAGDPGADMDGNGVIDTRDFIAYLNLWAAGCP